MADFIIDPSKHFGWAGPAAAKDAWDKIGHLFPTFAIKGSGPDDTVGKRFALYEIVRKVLNRDTRNYAQETGDCFVQGALIRLADGSACPIEEVGVGESVLSGAGNIQEVDSVIQKVYSGDLYQIAVTGRAPSPKCTADHQYQRPSGDWGAAALLKEGDYIRIASDYATTGIDAAKLVSITKTPATDITVNLV